MRIYITSSSNFPVDIETLVELDYFIPHDAPRGLRVEIIGYGTTDDGHVWKFENKTKDEIPVVKLGYNIFIQTDRPVYKPGQKSKILFDFNYLLNAAVFCGCFFKIFSCEVRCSYI